MTDLTKTIKAIEKLAKLGVRRFTCDGFSVEFTVPEPVWTTTTSDTTASMPHFVPRDNGRTTPQGVYNNPELFSDGVIPEFGTE
jgi:hypothetical protein